MMIVKNIKIFLIVILKKYYFFENVNTVEYSSRQAVYQGTRRQKIKFPIFGNRESGRRDLCCIQYS
ncbi:unnamed protein product [Meloidogyne enterolobii]|uniref:Uncharacterized protein n=1 Tax=Meloidogyne enterolobii TaxID=390850 RepID=A0ACB1AE73_MELEN